MAEDIGPNYSVRISRNIIVMYAYVQSFDKNTVFIQTHEGIVGFNITEHYREKAFSQLVSHIIQAKVAENDEVQSSQQVLSFIDNYLIIYNAIFFV